MSKWADFVWLSRQAADGLLYMWPITAALCGMLFIAVLRSFGKPTARPRGGWWLQFAPLCVAIAMLAFGSVFACENCSPSSLGEGVRHVWAIHAVEGLLVAQLAGAVGLVMLAAGARLVSATLQAIWLWCSFWAYFLAGMSISGDWV